MKKLLLTTLLFFGTIVHANQDVTTSTLEFGKEASEQKPEGFLPFVGLGGGYTGYDLTGAVEGSPATLKLLGSLYLTSPYVFDLGYGVNNQQFSQVTSTSLDTSITGGALEFAARYRWESRWQAGIVADQLFEQGKNLSASQGDAHFVGLQALREFTISPSWLGRIGARAMALTDNTTGTVSMYLVDLQIGWNPGAFKPTARSTAQSNPIQVPAPARPIAETTPEPILRDLTFSNLMAGEGSFINFNPSQFAVRSADRQKISKLAQALNKNKDLYERVEIHGFTDPSGIDTINQQLSQKRADEVRKLLQKQGLRDVNVVAIGEGSANSTGIKMKDRRAEIIFIGVKDEEKLREALSSVQ